MAFDLAVARRGLNSPWEAYIAALWGGDVSGITLTKAIIAKESAWIPNAENPSDPSIGLMQILIGSGGPAPMYAKEELRDPYVNLQVGITYLKYLIGRYGSTADAISAYNAGRPFRVDNWSYVNDVQTYWVWYLNHLPAIELSADAAPQITEASIPPQGESPIIGGLVILLLGVLAIMAIQR